MTKESSTPEKEDSMLDRIRERLVPEAMPVDDRGRMRMVVDSLVLHLHPTKVIASTMNWNYSWGLGGLSALLMAVLGLTGVVLQNNYTPAAPQAYLDILEINSNVWFGELVRNLHHWSANLLIVVAVLHLIRVFATGAYRPPRELNWLIGVAMLLLVVAANFTGYLLPWDQLAFWAITVGTKKIERVTTIPHLVRRELVFALAAFAVLLVFAMLVPAPLEGIANPDISPNPAKAPWYFMGLQELLLHFHPLIGAIILPGLAVIGIFLLPFFDINFNSVGIYFRSHRGRSLAILAVGIALVITPIWVLLDEFVLNWSLWLPTWNTLLSNGLIPMAVILVPLILLDEWTVKFFHADTEERVLFIATFLFTAFVVLTIIGIFFRGPGMALYWPWNMPVAAH
ncbi:MAG: cytochrome b N-terminal domain-containing protein [Anaerolineales bacterium]|uniref:cytochrome b N-terminal domain-containing protein n=1 Tax=Candidatus Villigracilis proximus TaxID=3140683 RepID=UPI003134F3FF|nr:cytochrome b N-terminal domain-containing protein [Anaerolineales bacterium]